MNKTKGWYWVLVRGINTRGDDVIDRWIVMEHNGTFFYRDFCLLQRYGIGSWLSDVRVVGPIQQPEGEE